VAAKAAVPAGPIDEVPKIEGLDTSNALRRVTGNRKLYMKLLRQFVEGQADATDRIRAAIAAGERAVAERLAHTVKGVAGSIGANALQAVADALEHGIKAGSESAAQVAAFETELGGLVGRLREKLPAVSQAADFAPAALDRAAVGPAVLRTAALLGDSDGDAVDFVTDNAGLLRPLFQPAQYGTFEKAVNSFDFEAALAELRIAALAHQLPIEG
jgi:HPt (histidine-containing phosphotransfer) domain-containing protein